MIAIGAAQDGKAFDVSQDVFAKNSLLGQVVVVLFLVGSEWLLFRIFVGCLAVGVPLLQSLIAGVGQHFGRGLETKTGGSEQGKIVCGSRREGGGDYAPGGFFEDDLGFEGVAFFLAGVETYLFFLRFGR